MNNQQDDNEELANALRAYGLKQRISELHREIVPNLNADASAPGKVRSMRPLLVRSAAVLIALVAMAATYIFISSTSNNLFNDKYVAYNIAPQRSGDSLENEDAVNSFTRGQTELKNNDPQKAIESFNEILSNPKNTNTLRDDSEYYLALSYLKAGETDLAYKRFLEISKNENHLYHDEVSAWFLFKLKVLSWKNK